MHYARPHRLIVPIEGRVVRERLGRLELPQRLLVCGRERRLLIQHDAPHVAQIQHTGLDRSDGRRHVRLLAQNDRRAEQGPSDRVPGPADEHRRVDQAATFELGEHVDLVAAGLEAELEDVADKVQRQRLAVSGESAAPTHHGEVGGTPQ